MFGPKNDPEPWNVYTNFISEISDFKNVCVWITGRVMKLFWLNLPQGQFSLIVAMSVCVSPPEGHGTACAEDFWSKCVSLKMQN